MFTNTIYLKYNFTNERECVCVREREREVEGCERESVNGRDKCESKISKFTNKKLTYRGLMIMVTVFIIRCCLVDHSPLYRRCALCDASRAINSHKVVREYNASAALLTS
jgi:hypothetical protein